MNPLCRLALMVAMLCAGIAQAAATRLPSDGPEQIVNCDRTGATDVTAAIQAAIDATWSAWEQVYLPEGTYLVSDRIVFGRFITLRGDGPGKTIIKLKNSAAGFGNASAPRGVVAVCDGGNCDATGHNNTTHSAHILNLTIDVGTGNPGAVAIDFMAHNGGGIESVALLAPGGSGHTGIWMMREATGPALIRDVTIDGFDYGVKINWGVYGMTFEGMTFRSQRVVAFDNSYHPVSLRSITSVNTVPFYRGITNDYGMLVLMDAQLTGGSASNAAIVSTGAVYLRNISTSGYRAALRDGASDIASPVTEYASQPIKQTIPSPNRSLMLAVKPRPSPSLDSPAQWASVHSYGSGDNWAPRIQAAIDAGKQTVYFRNFTHASYPGSGTVRVRAAVRNMIGMYARLEGTLVVCEVDDPSAVVYFEQMRFDGGFEHRGRATVVLNRCMGSSVHVYEGAGDVFVDDWCCGNFVVEKGCHVWARQLNEESLGTKLRVVGGSLWVLGLKTEQFGTVGHVSDGGALEILGCLLYPSQGRGDIMYINDNSSLAVFHREIGAGYNTFIREIRGGVTRTENPSFDMGTFYVSNADGIGSDVVAPTDRAAVAHRPANALRTCWYGIDGRRVAPAGRAARGAATATSDGIRFGFVAGSPVAR